MEKEKECLIGQLDRLSTTEMGLQRLQRNLGRQESEDIVAYCRELILHPGCRVSRRGKNWYCEISGVRITIHAGSCTIITAHRMP